MAGECIPVVKLTESGRPVLYPGEVECSLLSSVELLSEDMPSFPNLKSVLVSLTTHRLLLLQPQTNTSHFIPLSSIQNILSTKKSIKAMFHSPRIRFQVSISHDGRIAITGGSKSALITFMLRGKTDLDSFVGKLWDAWRSRVWEASGSGVGSLDGDGSRTESLAVRRPVVGLAGILRKE